MSNLITRAQVRLQEYDYSENGMYFVTVCTKNKDKIFWQIPVGADIIRPQPALYFDCNLLSDYGKIVYESILNIPQKYKYVTLEHFVVMPNHIHILLSINKYEIGKDKIFKLQTKDLSTIIGQFKRFVSKSIGKTVWQKSFYDHIIRNDIDFKNAWEYIDNNPLKWDSDDGY